MAPHPVGKEPGHCLSCDIMRLVHDYAHKPGATPIDILCRLTDCLAQTIVHASEDGKAISVGRDMTVFLAKQIAIHEESGQIDSASNHQAGRA